MALLWMILMITLVYEINNTTCQVSMNNNEIEFLDVREIR